MTDFFPAGLVLLGLACASAQAQTNLPEIVATNLGAIGTGTRTFRCGLAHSSGAVYLGTYGPQPAVVWKYHPDKGKLVQVGAPGEYQLDCMVEAPDGKIYIGTAYNALVYQLDPATDKIKSLGSPPLDSTPWIFNMVCTKKGEIYGAKGVGLFRLDWKNERLEAIGLVPGNHQTIGPNASNPIVRMLVEDAEGNIWGDTNRQLFKFIWNLKTGARQDHGKVWADDHRSNYGPAAFAGRAGRYFVGNHSEGMPSLWVTDTETDEHWRVGAAAVQLIALRDGTVWGTTGRNPATMAFQPGACWIPQWQAEPGILFRYLPGAKTVEAFAGIGKVGILVEAPGENSAILAAQGNQVLILDATKAEPVGSLPLKSPPIAAAADPAGTVAYFLLKDGALIRCNSTGQGQLELTEAAGKFGPAERGFFVLPKSKRVIGVTASGQVTVFDPATAQVQTLPGPAPLSSGPAVDPEEDAWYYASNTVIKFALGTP
jgi:streptogramin lyase